MKKEFAKLIVFVFGLMVFSIGASPEDPETDALLKLIRQATVNIIVDDLVEAGKDSDSKWEYHPYYAEAQTVVKTKKALLAAATTNDIAQIRKLKKSPYSTPAHDRLVNELAALSASRDFAEHILKNLSKGFNSKRQA